MEPITPLLSATILGSSTSGAGGQQHNPYQMQEGQILHALVTAAKSPDTFILTVGDNQILTRADSVTLSPGQNLQLQVTATRPVLELKIVTNPLQHYLGRALTFIGQNLDLAPLIQLLQQPSNPEMVTLSAVSSKVLEEFFTMQQQPPLTGKEGGEALRRMLEGIGLQVEAKLGQGLQAESRHLLKSALFEVLQQAGESEPIQEAGKSLLTAIESFQLSQLRLEQDKTLILPLPFPFLDQAYLLIDTKQEQNPDAQENRKQMRFSLHLALTGLGNLHIDFLQTDDGLWM